MVVKERKVHSVQMMEVSAADALAPARHRSLLWGSTLGTENTDYPEHARSSSYR